MITFGAGRKNNKLKVLLVDDSDIIRDRLKLMLKQIPGNIIISEAKNAGEAIKKMRNKKSDIIILDIKMPGENGVELLEKLKRDNQTVKIIILTNYPYPQYRKKCLELGAEYFLSKSTEFEILPSLIKKSM